MKKLLLITFIICLVSQLEAQTDRAIIQPIDDFAKHVYAGSIANIGVGTLVYSKTKRTGLACLSGFAAGIIAGGFKEMVYDKTWHRGTPNIQDFLATAWGACIAFPIVRCGIDIHERRQIKKEYYEFLKDSIETDITKKRTLLMMSYSKDHNVINH